MISRKLVKEVHIEARKLRELATDAERGCLNFDTLNPRYPRECIYGQMTGLCYSRRAESLIAACASSYIAAESFLEEVSCSFEPASPKTTDIHKVLDTVCYWSPIEVYISHSDADNKQLVAFLKGERKTLNLMGSVNC
jgi:hypothetical protein